MAFTVTADKGAKTGLAHFAGWCLVGAVAGCLAQFADGVATWLGDLTSLTGVWVLAIAGVALCYRRQRAAAAAAAVFAVAMVAGYYVTFALRIAPAPSGVIVMWLIAAVTVAPGLAALVAPRNAVSIIVVVSLLMGEAAEFVLRGTLYPAPLALDVGATIAICAWSRPSPRVLLASGAGAAVVAAAYVGYFAVFRLLFPG